jgi:hypothetical protein
MWQSKHCYSYTEVMKWFLYFITHPWNNTGFSLIKNSETNTNLNCQQLNSAGLKHFIENVIAHTNCYTFLCILKKCYILYNHFLLISAHMMTSYLGCL